MLRARLATALGTPPPVPTRRPFPWRWAIGTAACAAAVLLAVNFWPRPQPVVAPPSAPVTGPIVEKKVKEVGEQVKKEGKQLTAAQVLEAVSGRLR